METYKNGFALKSATIGVILAIVLCLVILGYRTNSSLLITLGILLALSLFSRKGITIDFENKRIQEFTSIVFLNVGVWYDAESYKNFQLGDKSSDAHISTDVDSLDEVSSTAIYLRNNESQNVVLLAKGEFDIMNELGTQLEKELGIPRKAKKQKLK